MALHGSGFSVGRKITGAGLDYTRRRNTGFGESERQQLAASLNKRSKLIVSDSAIRTLPSPALPGGEGVRDRKGFRSQSHLFLPLSFGEGLGRGDRPDG